MIRVLHLLGVCTDFQTRRTHECLCRDAGSDFHFTTRTLGYGGDYRNLPHVVRILRKDRADIVHAWSLPALTAAALAGYPNILFSPGQYAGPRALRWVRAVMGYRNVRMICASATQQRVAAGRGLPLDRCQVIRPGVEFSRIRKRRDDALRSALGLSPDDFVMLAPGESTRQSAHEEAVWACGILNVLDPRYKLLLWGRGQRATAAAKLSHRLHQPNMTKVAQSLLGEIEFEQLVPVADACLVTAKAPVPTLPIAICMAAALPIVSTVTYTVAELLEDRHTALMVPESSPRLIAQRVLDLRADAKLAWTIADTARAEAYEFFSLTRMLDEYRVAYRQFAEDRPQQVSRGIIHHGGTESTED